MTTSAPDGQTIPVRLERDRLTLSLYGYLAVWGWLLYGFNPSVPLLARELGITNAQAGLHGTAFAVGAVLMSRLTPVCVNRFGRRATLVGAGIAIALGTVVLVTGYTLVWTLTGVVVLASGGNAAVGAVQVGLTLRHGRASSAAVTEANGIGSSIGLLGPLAVGACVAAGWGWRPAVAVTAVLALVTALVVARLPAHPVLGRPRPQVSAALVAGVSSSSDTGRARFAGRSSTADRAGAAAGRWFLAALVAAIAIENATTFWATDLIIERTGAGAGIAAAATAGLVAGMSLIRFVVGPLSLRTEPARVLTASFLLAIVGWAILWTASSPMVALVGLFVAGLGYGAQYPLATSLVLGLARGSTDRAQGLATLAGGAAIGLSPLVLGALADAFGAHLAFLLVPVLALVGTGAAMWGGRAVRRFTAAQAAQVAAADPVVP